MATHRVHHLPHHIATATIALSASASNYLMAHEFTGAVTVNTTGFSAGKIALYSVVTGAAAVTSYTDQRSYAPTALLASGKLHVAPVQAPLVVLLQQHGADQSGGRWPAPVR